MQLHKAPLMMGGMMGLMLPWMMHIDNGDDAGLALVLAHVAVVVGIAGVALFIPSLRHKLVSLKGHVSHFPVMATGLAAGWLATCIFCLAIGGVHWT